MSNSLKPLVFGNLRIWPPIIQAPVAGYTGSVYRQILREHGCPYCYTEMISSKGLVLGGDNSKKLLVHPVEDKPLAVQIFGNEPFFMEAAVKMLQQFVAGRFEAIDINMGCPARKIAGAGSGGGLLANLSLAEEIIRAVKGVSRVPVTVKTRLGWDGTQDPCKIASRIEAAGADMLVIHGRTVHQGYSGKADWDALLKVAQSVSIPVVGNGDIAGAREAVSKASSKGIAGVMVGRAALGNPFLFSQCLAFAGGETPAAVTTKGKMEVAKDHFSRTLKAFGERQGLLEMRKHLAFYLRGIKGASALRDRINKESSPQGVIGILDEVAEEAAI